jgi:hypothetical protein
MMRYVDHEPAAWFLVEDEGVLYLDARYTYSALIDDSALIRLDDTELRGYLSGGRDYISDLARGIDHSAPYRVESAYFARDLYRSPGGPKLRDAVGAAIVDHTWAAHRSDRTRPATS